MLCTLVVSSHTCRECIKLNSPCFSMVDKSFDLNYVCFLIPSSYSHWQADKYRVLDYGVIPKLVGPLWSGTFFNLPGEDINSE